MAALVILGWLLLILGAGSHAFVPTTPPNTAVHPYNKKVRNRPGAASSCSTRSYADASDYWRSVRKKRRRATCVVMEAAADSQTNNDSDNNEKVVSTNADDTTTSLLVQDETPPDDDKDDKAQIPKAALPPPPSKATTTSEQADVLAAFSTNDSNSGATAVSVTTMLNLETKRILIEELGYKRRDVERMRVELAQPIIEKRLKCPDNGIMPDSWIDPDYESMSQQTDKSQNPLQVPLVLLAIISLLLLGIGISMPPLDQVDMLDMSGSGSLLTETVPGVLLSTELS